MKQIAKTLLMMIMLISLVGAVAPMVVEPRMEYDAEWDLGIVANKYDSTTLQNNTTKLNAALQGMWKGASVTFAHGPSPGPVIRPIRFSGKTFYFKPPILTSDKIGGCIVGTGGQSYIMSDDNYDNQNNHGGMRTRIVGVNSTGETYPVIRLKGSGFEIRGMDILGQRLPSISGGVPQGTGDKAIACIQVEGGNSPRYRGKHVFRDLGLYMATYGIQTIPGYYTGTTFTGDENHADLSYVENLSAQGVASVFRSENQLSLGWNFNQVEVGSAAYDGSPVTIFDIQRGGQLFANSILIDSPNCVLINTHDFSPYTNNFNITNILWDNYDFGVHTYYLTLFKYSGTTDASWLFWNVRITGSLAEYDVAEYDETKLIDIPGTLTKAACNIFTDIQHLPTEIDSGHGGAEFTISGSGPWYKYTP